MISHTFPSQSKIYQKTDTSSLTLRVDLHWFHLRVCFNTTVFTNCWQTWHVYSEDWKLGNFFTDVFYLIDYSQILASSLQYWVLRCFHERLFLKEIRRVHVHVSGFKTHRYVILFFENATNRFIFAPKPTIFMSPNSNEMWNTSYFDCRQMFNWITQSVL